MTDVVIYDILLLTSAFYVFLGANGGIMTMKEKTRLAEVERQNREAAASIAHRLMTEALREATDAAEQDRREARLKPRRVPHPVIISAGLCRA